MSNTFYFAKRSFCWLSILLLCTGCDISPQSTTHQQTSEKIVQIEKEAGANPWNHLDFNNDPENFQFAIVTDLTGRLRPNVFPDAIRKLNLLQPEFIVTIGDLIEGHTNDAAQLNREWDAFFKAVEPLEMPIFYIPGNHDYWYRSAQNSKGEVEVYDMTGVYRKRVGRSYYDFTYRDVLFLVLNNTMGDPAEMEEQKRYITKTLDENSNVRWTFTFFHYDGFPNSDLWTHVKKSLGERPYTAFAGNSHNYLKYTDNNGMEMIRLATTGGMSRMRGPEFGEMDHLTLITVTDNGPKISHLLLDGIYDTNVRTVKSVEMANLLLPGAYAKSGTSPVRSEPVLVDGNTFSSRTTNVEIKNPADIPLHFRATFEPNDRLRPEPAFFEIEIPPASKHDMPIDISVNSPVAVADISTLVMNWTAGYKLPGDDPDVEINGKERLIIDTKGKALQPDWPVMVEDFSGHLDPAWVPLGPGGGFNEQGRFVLIDNPPPLPGERKDAYGRYTDGPLFETGVHTPTEDRVYRYTDGRGIYMMTPLFQLPLNGIYRDIPADSFQAELKVSEINWGGAIPELHWEFWDSPDLIYNYGPSYLSGIIVVLAPDGDAWSLKLQKFIKTGYGTTSKSYSYTDIGTVPLDTPPESLSLRANWQESTRTWRFAYGLDGAEATTPFPGGEFIEDIRPSPDGKRNLVYIRQAREDSNTEELQGGFSVVLDEYRLLH